MGIISKMLQETGVYWPPSSVDAYGQPTWGTAVEISVRWTKKSVDFRDVEGEEQFSNGLVFTSVDVEVKGVLWLGTLATADTANPKDNSDAWEVRGFDKIPNFKATEWVRKAYI